MAAGNEFGGLRERLLRVLEAGPRDSLGPDILGFNVDQPTQADSQGFSALGQSRQRYVSRHRISVALKALEA